MPVMLRAMARPVGFYEADANDQDWALAHTLQTQER
jgi:hypothetical protein